MTLRVHSLSPSDWGSVTKSSGTRSRHSTSGAKAGRGRASAFSLWKSNSQNISKHSILSPAGCFVAASKRSFCNILQCFCCKCFGVLCDLCWSSFAIFRTIWVLLVLLVCLCVCAWTWYMLVTASPIVLFLFHVGCQILVPDRQL